MAPIAQRMVARQLSEAFRARGEPAAATLEQACAAMSPDGYASSCAVLRDTDLRPVLGRIQAPTLVITGETDPMLEAADVDAMVKGIPGARCETLPTGHLSAVEAPQAFAETVLRFLTE
jgi:pimeloyl-ACP methyl ester carboxylesterase